MEISNRILDYYSKDYECCRDTIQEATVQIEYMESISKKPAIFINENFDKNKNHINWRRRELIESVNKYCDQLVEENESKRSYCLNSSEETFRKHVENKFDEIKREFGELKNKFEQLDRHVNQLGIRLSQNTAFFLKGEIIKMLDEYKDALLLKKEFLFIFYERPMENVVGKLIDKKQVH